MAAFWIARVTVSDPDTYKLYAESAPEAFKKYNARILARGGRHEVMEGDGRPRNVVIEFDTLEDAVACYNSPRYQEAVKIAKASSTRELMVVEETPA